MKRPKVLILGAGYGGLITAVRLQRSAASDELDLTLVNKHRYHFFTTWLHAPAAGTKDPKACCVDINSIIDKNKVELVVDTIANIMPSEKKVQLESGKEVFYDYLVIAVGSEPETFGIPGLKEHTYSIRSLNSVREIANHIEQNFISYMKSPSPELLTFVIGGAGFTGVEFTGELADQVPKLCAKHGVDPKFVKIINVEAAPTVLPGFDASLSEHATNVLSNKGVTFKTSTAIKECTQNGIILANGETIQTNTVVWTGGVRGHHLIEQAGFESVRGRVKVDEYLHAPEYEDVFIIGDGSLVINPGTDRPYPPTAQLAIQQGENLAKNLLCHIRKQPMTPFVFAPKGTVASLGKGQGIGLVGKTKIYGRTASFIKKVVDARSLYLIGGLSLLVKRARL